MLKKFISIICLSFIFSGISNADTIYPVEKFIDLNKIYDGVSVPLVAGPPGPQGPQGPQGSGSANTYNILDYGAIANDGLDDTVAIQLAWDTMIASGVKGSHLYIPNGTWKFSDTLNFRFNSFWDAHIIGEGNSSILEWIGDNTQPKPAIRLIGPYKSIFRDFRINVTTSVSTLILVETSSGVVVTRSNNFIRVRGDTGPSGSYEKGIQFTAGDDVSLSFPSILDAAGVDGNNDHNAIKQCEFTDYSIAAISFENQQSKVNYIEQLQADASRDARDASIAAMDADPNGQGSPLSLDQGINGIGPYAITTGLSKGGSPGRGGSFYVNGGVFHNNVIDIYVPSPNRDPLSIYGNVNSETGLRFLQVGPRGWTSLQSPVHVTGVTWTSTHARSDSAGIITIGHMGPTKFEGNFFKASNGAKLNFGIGNKEGPINFSYNLWEWTDGVDSSVNHDPFTIISPDGNLPNTIRMGNTYVDTANVPAFRSDELP